MVLLRGVVLLYWALVLCVLSLLVHYPLGQAVSGNLCGANINELCHDPTEQWGFPVPYIQEYFMTSMGRRLHVWRFLANLLFYGVLLAWLTRKIKRVPIQGLDLGLGVGWMALLLMVFYQGPTFLLPLGGMALVALWVRRKAPWWNLLATMLLLLGGAWTMQGAFGGQGLDLTWFVAGAGLCFVGLNLPVVWSVRMGFLLLLAGVQTGWWLFLVNSPLFGAMATDSDLLPLMWVLLPCLVTLFAAPQFLWAWVNRTNPTGLR